MEPVVAKPVPAWEEAIKWVRSEMSRRAPDEETHRSFLADKVLEEAQRRFNLPTHGVEGWSFGVSGDSGVQYLNTGDLYDTTLYIVSGHTWHRCSLGSVAKYAGG